MNDLAVILPVRVDNGDRLENLRTSIRFLLHSFPESEILVIEDDLVQRTSELARGFPSVRFFFQRNADRFSRALLANRGICRTTRPIVALWDLDVLVKASAVKSAAASIRSGRETIVLPHNTLFVNVGGETKKRLVRSLDPTIIPHVWHRRQKFNNRDLHPPYPSPSGVVMFDRTVILAEGGFNRKFRSYGWEDTEFIKRMRKLGYYTKIQGGANVVHLNHARGLDSRPNSFTEKNRQIYRRVAAMTRQQLEQYVEQQLADPESAAFRKRTRRMHRKCNIRSLRFFRDLVDRTVYRILTRYV